MLLDTTVLIDLLRNSQAARRLIASMRIKPSASVVSLTELITGARSRREEVEIGRLTASIRFLPVDEAIAIRGGQFVKHFAASHGLDDLDGIIAATAEHHGLELVTLNVKHFPMFKRLKTPY